MSSAAVVPGSTDSTAFGARDVDAPHHLGRALDFEAADSVAEVLETEFPRRWCIDVADLAYVDVAGMRALCGHDGAPLLVSAESEAVRRLVGLLGCDTDPFV